MAIDDGASGRERLDRIRRELGRDYVDPTLPSRESRTRSELLREEGPPSDVTAPSEPDMWDEEDKERALPPPEYNGRKYIAQSTKSMRATRRPDKYPEFWGSGPKQSTRVAGMQWIPVLVSGKDAIGDLVVAFARPSASTGNRFYVYEKLTRPQWESISSSNSIGKDIKAFEGEHPYRPFEFGSDDSNYKELHARSGEEGTPWDDWLFELTFALRSGEGNYSETWSSMREAVSEAGRESSRKAKEASKKTRAAARQDRKEGGSRRDNRSVSLDYQPPDRNDY